MNYKRFIKINLNSLFIAVLLFGFLFQPVFAQDIKPLELYNNAWKILNEKYYLRAKIDFNKLQNKFDSKIKTSEDAHFYIKKLLAELNDPYTRFLTKEEFNEEQELINSMLTGIGVKLALDKPFIVDVLPESPAHQCGMKPNDYILKVNEEYTRNLTTNQVASLLRGKKDSWLTVTFKRNKDILTKSLKREDIKFNAVSSELLESNIALIRIDSLIPENTSKLFKNEITKFKSADGVILDLRNNSGGLLKNAIEIADMFLKEGKIVSTVGPYGKTNELANSNVISNSHIVILVNERTASAGEILASALKENNRAIILGKKTFGKGLVQEIVKLSDDSALHVTIASYLTPGGNNINKKGITPDEIIPDDKKLLQRATSILLNSGRTQIAAL